MKQTAVEWLFTELCSERLSWNKDSNGKLFIAIETCKLLNEAKEIEKEQIIEAYNDGWDNYYEPEFKSAERYYNETFKSE